MIKKESIEVEKMTLKGIVSGEYQDHAYAKIFCLEEFQVPQGFGENAVVSKLNVDEYNRLKEDWELYANQEVYLIYNRYGRVDRVELAD